jgi:hypothetical protein
VTWTFESLDCFLGARMPYLQKIWTVSRVLSSVEIDSASRSLALYSSSSVVGSDGFCIVGPFLRGADLVVVVRANVDDFAGVDLVDDDRGGLGDLGGADLKENGEFSGDVRGVDLIDGGEVEVIDGGGVDLWGRWVIKPDRKGLKTSGRAGEMAALSLFSSRDIRGRWIEERCCIAIAAFLEL